jgi:hypothetical protein
MASQFREKFTYIVSAPPGALGEYLAVLLEFCLNPSLPKPNFAGAKSALNRDVQNFWTPYEDFLLVNNENVDKINELIDSDSEFLPFTEPSKRVLFSNLAAETLVGIFPNSKIITITTEEQDGLQLGYNHLVNEINALDRSWVKIDRELISVEASLRIILGDNSIDFKSMLTDPMCQDSLEIYVLSHELGKNYCKLKQATGAVESTSSFEVKYSELCVLPKDNKEAIDKIIDTICKHVDDSIDSSQAKDIWLNFMNTISPIRKIT